MIIYNRELEQIEDLETQSKIEQIIKKQVDFLVSNYGMDRQMIENKLRDLSIVEYSKRNDKTYLKKINGEIKEFSIRRRSRSILWANRAKLY